MMEWISVKDKLPPFFEAVLVNDLNGEGVVIAWRAEWYSNGKANGDWQWCFQIPDLEHSDVKIAHWCAYSEPPGEC